jgi:nucleotide-binding universal stress UspA family protein
MYQPIESILVPTDGSEASRAGARRGIDLAASLDADLAVIAVVDTRELEPSLSALRSDETDERERVLEDEAERAVDEIARLARTHLSGSVTTTIEHGVPVEMITRYADAHGSDLVVMGTHGRTGLERVVLGSTTAKTLRTSRVPVMTVPPGASVVELGDAAYEDVLLPTDGSEGAEVAVEWGLALAVATDATVHTVYSVETSHFAGLEGVAQIHDALEEVGREALDTVRDLADARNVSVTGHVATGPAARMILSYADDNDADVIVMGTHGRTGVQRYLIGSVTETVVRQADVPVCAVPMQNF